MSAVPSTPTPTPSAPTTLVQPQVGTTPTTNTTAYKQKETAKKLQDVVDQLFNAKAVGLRQIFNFIWANPFGLSPALAIAALKTNAVLAFTQFSEELALLAAQAPAGWVYPDTKATLATTLTPPVGYVITPNADGSITIVEP